MRQYRSLVRVLDRDLAVRPLPETTRLYDDVRAGRLDRRPSRPRRPRQTILPRTRTILPLTGLAAAGTATWPLVGRDRPSWPPCARPGGRPAGEGHGGIGRSGRVVAIAGEAGSGKTRLIAELRAEAAEAGAAVLAARGHDGETGLPFVLAADLLRTALAVRPDLPDTLPAQTAAMAGRLIPALAASHPDTSLPAGQPGRGHQAVRGDRGHAAGGSRRR